MEQEYLLIIEKKQFEDRDNNRIVDYFNFYVFINGEKIILKPVNKQLTNYLLKNEFK